jgi:hypothetical protein
MGERSALIKLSYQDFKRLKTIRVKKRGIYGLLIFGPILLLSYAPLININKLLMGVTDLTILRVVGLAGFAVSCLAVWKGEKINLGLGFFAEARRLEEECGGACRVFESIIKGDWS